MSEDAFDELGWVVQCACCGRKQDFPMQSRNIAMQVARAQGWYFTASIENGVELIKEYCPEFSSALGCKKILPS